MKQIKCYNWLKVEFKQQVWGTRISDSTPSARSNSNDSCPYKCKLCPMQTQLVTGCEY